MYLNPFEHGTKLSIPAVHAVCFFKASSPWKRTQRLNYMDRVKIYYIQIGKKNERADFAPVRFDYVVNSEPALEHFLGRWV